MDLNVFRGTPSAFLELMQGTWIPDSQDLMPVQEPSEMQIASIKVSTIDKPVVIKVNVKRPTGDPVVTGTVKFVADPINPLLATPIQTATRASSGSWTLSIPGLQVGKWLGKIVFTDISGTHASSSAPVSFEILPSATATPTPTPTDSTIPTITPTPTPTPSKTVTPKPTPTVKPSPTKSVAVDACKNQIRN